MRLVMRGEERESRRVCVCSECIQRVRGGGSLDKTR